MFELKTKIVFGRGIITEEGEKIEGEKAVIFSSNSMEKYGFTGEIASAINMEYKIITGIKPEPDEKDVKNYVEILEREEPDVIIAIGGGSTIDTAKAALYHYKKSSLIAIPSTSGSGSEVTKAAVLSRNGIKYSVVADHIAPKIAILDTRLPEKMPAPLAARAGMDALSHAIESYVSNISSPFSRAFSAYAAKYILEWLPSSVKGNRIARERMHFASCMAGIAILNARVGLCHVMAHKLGILGIPHGLAIALLLDTTMEYNMEFAGEKYDMMAREIGLENGRILVEKIRELKRNIGIKGMHEYVDEKDYIKKIDVMAKEASEDILLKFNPRKAGFKEIRKLYEEAYAQDIIEGEKD